MQTINLLHICRNRRHKGISTMPGLVALLAVTLVVVQIDLPKAKKEMQQTQAMANTNGSVQQLSAALSYFNDHGVWPTALNELAPYLPIQPKNNLLQSMTKLSTNNTNAELLFNVGTYAQAKQLARHFNQLDIEIVNQHGDISHNHAVNTFVKVQLDATKYGQWQDFGPWRPANECPADTGKLTRYGHCKKDNQPFAWCLGDKAETKNCDRAPEWLKGEYTYGACINKQQTKKPKNCKQGWHDGEQVACDTEGTTEMVTCEPAYWQEDWGEWGFLESGWYLIAEQRSVVNDICMKGFIDEAIQECDPSLQLPIGFDIFQYRYKWNLPNFKSGWIYLPPVKNEAFFKVDESLFVINLETRDRHCDSNCP